MGLKVTMLKNMVCPALLTKNMHKAMAEWYLTLARHHGEGAWPSLSDTQGYYWVIRARKPVQFSIFGGAKPLPGAPVGPFVEKTPDF